MMTTSWMMRSNKVKLKLMKESKRKKISKQSLKPRKRSNRWLLLMPKRPKLKRKERLER